MSKEKSKSATRPQRTDLHAISPLPIDFIEHRMQQLSKRGLTVSFVNLNKDGRAFQMKHPEMRSFTTGTLRRWEGTHTRVDATTTLQIPPHWIEWVVHFIVIFFLFLVFSGCSVFAGAGYMISFIASLVLATILALLLPISQYFDRFRKQAVKDADRQMQLIALILTSNLPDGTAPLVEFDGTDRSLEVMLRRHNARPQK